MPVPHRSLMILFGIGAMATPARAQDCEYGFKLLDLGGASQVFGINDAGQVVGRNDVWDPVNGPRSLGSLGGATVACCLNEAGQVAGNSIVTTGISHAFFWDEDDGMQDLGTLGGEDSRATGINDLGQVVGYSNTATGDEHAFLWDQQNGMQDLGTILTDSRAVDINNLGQVVGISFDDVSDISDHLTLPFVWDQANGLQVLRVGAFGETCCGGVNMINEWGMIAGWGSFPTTTDYVACRFSASSPDSTPTFLSFSQCSEALFVRGDGQTVGWEAEDSQPSCQSPFWQRDARVFSPANMSWGSPFQSEIAIEITPGGQILLGLENIEDIHGYLALAPGGPIVDLQDLTPQPLTFHTLEPDGINDHGEIAGAALDQDLEGSAPYILWPCPADIDDSGAVGVGDLLEVLGAWGPCPPPPPGCPADTNKDGVVNVVDLLTVLGGWS